MSGTIVLNNAAGRALRRKPADVKAQDVLDCAGRFAAGDTVYVTFRAIDGGQYVVATGIVRCENELVRSAESATVIVRGQDLRLLW